MQTYDSRPGCHGRWPSWLLLEFPKIATHRTPTNAARVTLPAGYLSHS